MGDRIVAGRAAIERDDQRCARVDQLVDRRDIGAIALEDPVGDVDLRIEPEMPQVTRHQCAGTGSVDIVVAEQGDALVVGDRRRQARRQDIHVGERRGIRHQGTDRRREESLGLLGGHAASCHDARKDFGQPAALADHRSSTGGAEIEPVQPGAPGHGVLHIEEECLRIGHRRRGNRKHPARSRAHHAFAGKSQAAGPVAGRGPFSAAGLSGCARP